MLPPSDAQELHVVGAPAPFTTVDASSTPPPGPRTTTKTAEPSAEATDGALVATAPGMDAHAEYVVPFVVVRYQIALSPPRANTVVAPDGVVTEATDIGETSVM